MADVIMATDHGEVVFAAHALRIRLDLIDEAKFITEQIMMDGLGFGINTEVQQIRKDILKLRKQEKLK